MEGSGVPRAQGVGMGGQSSKATVPWEAPAVCSKKVVGVGPPFCKSSLALKNVGLVTEVGEEWVG